MRHLRHAAIKFDAAAYNPLGVDREQPCELVAFYVEINERQYAGVVGAEHPIGASPVAGLVRLDAHRERRNMVGLERADRRRGAPARLRATPLSGALRRR